MSIGVSDLWVHSCLEALLFPVAGADTYCQTSLFEIHGVLENFLDCMKASELVRNLLIVSTSSAWPYTVVKSGNPEKRERVSNLILPRHSVPVTLNATERKRPYF